MSEDRYSVSRLSFLEKENYDLRVKLDQSMLKLNNIMEKHEKLSVYSKMLEDCIDGINRKIFNFKGQTSPLLNILGGDPVLVERALEFEDEWFNREPKPKPILNTIKEEEENEEDFYSEGVGFVQNTERFEDLGMNEDDEFGKDVNYYFSDVQLEEMDTVIVPHLEKMEDKSASADSSVSYYARKEVAIKALRDLHLKYELEIAIAEFGWQKVYHKELTPVINDILEGFNIIIEDPAKPNLHLCKIATLALSVLQQIRPHIKCCQALFLVPSRELAQKIHRVVKALAMYLDITSHVCIGGGTRLKQEALILSDGVQVVIGTPGRVLDLIHQRTLRISEIKYLTIGDAEEMFTGQFEYQTKTIFLNLREDKQVVLLTSGSNEEVAKWCDSFMKDRYTIPIQEAPHNLEGVKQYYLTVDYRDQKWRPLMDIRNRHPNMRMVVICNSHKRVVEWISYQMRQKGESVLSANATLSPEECEDILEEFASGDIPTLITTELVLLAEENYLENVDLLVNYELPITPHNYYDRISFCGRDFEQRGMVINFISGKTPTQLQLLRKIEQFCDTKVTKLPITDND